jgi:hypothetical protein
MPDPNDAPRMTLADTDDPMAKVAEVFIQTLEQIDDVNAKLDMAVQGLAELHQKTDLLNEKIDLLASYVARLGVLGHVRHH